MGFTSVVIALNESNSMAFFQLKMTIIPPLTHPLFNSPGRAHNHKPSHFVNNFRTFSSFQKLPLNIYKSVSASRLATKLTKRLKIIKNKSSQRFQKNLQTMGAPEKDPREEVLQAWYMDDSDEDQRLPHHKEPKEFVSLDQLAELGVLSWRLDADNYETDEELKKIREARGYSYMDFCEVSPEKLPNYEEKIKSFFEEHLHTDEEIRYSVAGSGYFDVRDRNEKWIRVWVKKGGLIILPAGIYHRFTLDSDNYIKAMRLFIGDPIWTPFNRPHDDLPARKEYLKTFVEKEVGDRAVDAAA